MNVLLKALIEEGLITEEQVREALDKQFGAKKPIQELLVEMDFIKEDELVKISSRVFNMPVTNLNREHIDPNAIKAISYETAKRYGVLPIRVEGNTLVVATSDPTGVITLDDIRAIARMNVKPLLSTRSQIAASIEKYYQSDDVLYDLLKNVGEETKVEVLKAAKPGDKHFDMGSLSSSHAPVVKLVNIILSDAVKMRASDIHIEPQENSVKVRYRIDGDLRNIMDVPKNVQNAVTARIKIMAELDPAETRKVQDGRTGISVFGRNIDLRVSMVPAYYGEKAVLRILDPKEARVDLETLGFSDRAKDLLKQAVALPQGMILVTGPTGSGKTSTLYAAINYVKSEAKNIITLEDPIEYSMEGINQIQIHPVKNITFASGLRSILRQDPNIILVGEIRDEETAKIAFGASMTGHLVMSTLHTNSAVATVTRLLNIGVEPYLISSAVTLIMAQRLIKIICPDCKEEYEPDAKLVKKFKEYIDKYNIKKFYHGKGCDRCMFTGYHGRTAIFELLGMNDKLRELVIGHASEEELFEEGRKSGLNTLAESGIQKVAQGRSTLEEVAGVVTIVESDMEAAPKTPETPEKETPQTILVADDEEHIARIIENRLKSAGYEVIKAKDGMEAVERALRDKPDLIVMDYMMPKMNGIEAIKTLRSKLETAVIPIMMLTAKKDADSEMEGLDAGADDYITKPFDGQRLLARIKMLLRRKK
ncbi:MAG: ATPase, T2SS/T4P/T4SS family [Candidatus Omnitrophota bacterium]